MQQIYLRDPKKFYIDIKTAIALIAFVLIVIAGYAVNKANAENKNCSVFKYQQTAQLYYNALINDPNPDLRKTAERLDKDKDKIACEKLPKK